MAVNLPVFFGELLVGGLLLYHGAKDVAAALTGASSGSGSTLSTTPNQTSAGAPYSGPSLGSAGQQSWAKAVLAGIDAPITPGNITALVTWQGAEGGPADNPLNTTLGQGDVQGSAIKGYGSVAAGVTATIDTLLGGNYGEVVNALRSNAGPDAIKAAVIASPWDGSTHYAGTNYGDNASGTVA